MLQKLMGIRYEKEVLDYSCRCAGWWRTAGRVPGSNRWKWAADGDCDFAGDTHIVLWVPSRNGTWYSGGSPPFLSGHFMGATKLPDLWLWTCEWTGWSDAEEHDTGLP